MKKIYAVHESDPGFDPANHAAGVQRFEVGAFFVDAIGGKPTKVEVDAVTGHSVEHKIADLVAAVQAAMDARAQLKGYDDIKSAALRAGYPGPFHDEGVAFAQWMDLCWATAYTILAEVTAGTRPLPTVEEAVAAMPALVLPA